MSSCDEMGLIVAGRDAFLLLVPACFTTRHEPERSRSKNVVCDYSNLVRYVGIRIVKLSNRRSKGKVSQFRATPFHTVVFASAIFGYHLATKNVRITFVILVSAIGIADTSRS